MELNRGFSEGTGFILPAMQILRLTLFLAASAFAAAQSPPPPLWQMQESGTTAGLRGID
jgi:hypothetical protein